MDKWEPEGGIEEFRERCIEVRAKGGTWTKIAQLEKVKRRTLYYFFSYNKGFKESVNKVSEPQLVDNLRETAIEVALSERNVTMLIYLLKSLGKMYDSPKGLSDEPPAEESTKVPSMTRAEAKKLLASKKGK